MIMTNGYIAKLRGISSLLFTGVGSLAFSGTSDFVHSTLHFLLLLSGLSLGFILEEFISSEVALGVVGLSSINAVVDESISGGSATTELGLHTEDSNLLILGLEGSGELLLDCGLGYTSAIWVDNLEEHLLSGEKWVIDELLQVEHELLDHLY